MRLGEDGYVTYGVELEPLVGLLVVVPYGPIVLVHHDAWPAPVQMYVDHYYPINIEIAYQPASCSPGR